MLKHVNGPLRARENRFRRWTHALFALWFCSLVGPAWAVDKVYYLDDHGDDKPSINFQYPLELLQLAIAKTGNKIELLPYKAVMPKRRSLMELKAGRKFNVYWGVSSPELEQDLLPVKICMMKGVMGWRIPLVTAANHQLFENTKTVNDLRAFTAGQGTQWEDTKILRAAKLRVETTSTVALLEKMLAANRFDYFPRGVTEIWEGTQKWADAGILVDNHIAIHYNNPFYFFFNRNQPELADMVHRGLEIALHDGSFDKLFYRYFGTLLHKANLESRTVIALDNTLLPPLSAAERKSLWLPPKAVNSRN